jgi:hypothetical protein
LSFALQKLPALKSTCFSSRLKNGENSFCHSLGCREESHNAMRIYEVRPRKDKRGVDLISDALPFGRLWYGESNEIANANGYANFYSRSHRACDSRLWRGGQRD